MYDTLTALSIGNSNSTTFEVEDPADGPVYFTGWTKATDVEVNILIDSPPPNATSSTIGLSQTSTSSSSAGTGAAPPRELVVGQYRTTFPLTLRYLYIFLDYLI